MITKWFMPAEGEAERTMDRGTLRALCSLRDCLVGAVSWQDIKTHNEPGS